MPFIIKLFTVQSLRLYLPVFIIFVSSYVRAQTYSTEEIVISGLGFARLSVSLISEDSFNEQPAASRWIRIFDRNLCWSGVFLVTDSRYRSCRTTSDANVDMKFILKINQNRSSSGKLISKKIMFTVADNNGNPLFPLELKLRKGRFSESDLMELINDLSAQLTGLEGVMGSTIAFTLKQPQRRKIIARVNTHGKKLAAISRNPNISLLPKWNTKGDAIVYTTFSRKGTSIIYDDLNLK